MIFLAVCLLHGVRIYVMARMRGGSLPHAIHLGLAQEPEETVQTTV